MSAPVCQLRVTPLSNPQNSREGLTPTPDGFQGNLKLGKVVDHVLEHRPTLVAPTTLMITKRPVLLHGWQPNRRLLVRLDHILCLWAAIKVQVNAPSHRPPCETGRLQKDLLGMSIPEEHAMRVRHILCRRVRCIGDISELS